MVTSQCLAFLLCDKASKSPEGKANLEGVFDRIVTPQLPTPRPQFFFSYYQAALDQPCAVVLKLFGPDGDEIRGAWRDEIREAGLVQSVWTLTTTLFKHPGTYRLELRQIRRDATESVLISRELVVDQSNAPHA